jgi:hypothetical protein
MKYNLLLILSVLTSSLSFSAYAEDKAAEHVCEMTVKVTQFNAFDREYYNDAAQMWHTATAFAVDRDGRDYVFYLDMTHNVRPQILIPLQHSIAERKFTSLKVKTTGNCDSVYLVTENDIVSTELSEMMDSNRQSK